MKLNYGLMVLFTCLQSWCVCVCVCVCACVCVCVRACVLGCFKRAVYKAVVLATLLYGLECWAVKAGQIRHLEVFHHCYFGCYPASTVD